MIYKMPKQPKNWIICVRGHPFMHLTETSFARMSARRMRKLVRLMGTPCAHMFACPIRKFVCLLTETSYWCTFSCPMRKLMCLTETSDLRTCVTMESVRLKEYSYRHIVMCLISKTLRLLDHSNPCVVMWLAGKLLCLLLLDHTNPHTQTTMVSMFHPTVSPTPKVVYGVIHLSLHLSYHCYLII